MSASASDATNLPSPRARFVVGQALGVAIDVVAWAPADADVDLSIACMFEREADGASLSGGLLHLDLALDGLLTRLRADGVFRARELDSILLEKPPTSLQPRALMIIGLGDPSTFTADRLERAACFAALQAMRVGARSAAFAPNLLDAGLSSSRVGPVASTMLRGVLAALASTRLLAASGLTASPSLEAWSFDTGASHIDSAAAEFRATFAQASSPETLHPL